MIFWPAVMAAVLGETVRPLIAAVAGVTDTDAAAVPPVEAVAVTVMLPAATAVTRQAPALTAAVATEALLEAQAVSVGGVVALPPVI